MEYNELLYDFVDGATTPSQEQALFSVLAENEELRSDLKQLLAMRTAVQNDTKAFIPPASSTLALFSSLGFSAPAALVPVEVGIGARMLEFLGNSSKAITTGVVMSGITALCMYFWMQDTGAQHQAQVTGTSTVVAVESSASSAARTAPGNHTSQPPAGQDHSIITPPERIIKYVYIREKSTVPNGSIALSDMNNMNSQSVSTSDMYPSPEANAPAFLPVSTVEFHTSSAPATRFTTQSTLRPAIVDIPQSSDLLPPEQSTPLWSLELRRLDTRSTDEPTVMATAPTYNNLALTGLLSWNSRFSTGVEFAQEQYFQSFTSVDTRGNRYLYEQNPSLSSLSVVARYMPFEWQKFQPILQLGVGGTTIGPIGRGLLGMRYSPEKNVSFMLNLEGSALRYSHQNINYTLIKFGLSYGISLHF